MNLMTIHKIALKLGALNIHWYAILIVVGATIGMFLAIREAPKKGLTTDDVIDFIIISFPLALVGVRAYYVAFQWGYYSQHPSQIIALWDGGGAIYGGLIVGVIVLVIFSRFRKINAWDLLDISVPGILIGQTFGRWGNFVNQEAYGKIVSQLNYLPNFIRDQMFINGAYRAPTFLFESVGDFIGFLIIFIFRHKIKSIKRGDIFAFYLIWYGLVRFVVEGMRTDSLMLGSARVSQWLSGFLILLGGVFILYHHSKLDTQKLGRR